MAEKVSKMHYISNNGGSHWEVMFWADVGEKNIHLD